MKLTFKTREAGTRALLNRLRREGQVPAVVYSQHHGAKSIVVDGNEFSKYLRQISQGHLPTTKFELVGETENYQVMVKEIQYHPTSYAIRHIDFVIIEDQVPVNVKVPVRVVGQDSCVGVKMGGFVRTVIRHLRVRCLPKDMPSFFELDIKDLNIRQSKRVRDIVVPAEVKMLTPQNEVVVVIAKR